MAVSPAEASAQLLSKVSDFGVKISGRLGFVIFSLVWGMKGLVLGFGFQVEWRVPASG